MTKGMWLGGVLLSLSGWVSGLSAQDVIWRPTVRSAAPSVRSPGNSPGPAATLGRPIVLTEEKSDAGILQASYQAPSTLARAQNQAVTASPTYGQAVWEEARNPGITLGGGQVVSNGWRSDVRRPQTIQTSFGGNTYTIPQPYVAPPPEMTADTALFPGEGPLPASRFYLNAEYLLWWTKADRVPPLASTSSNPNDFGFLGNPTTQVLFAGLDRNPFQGARITAGVALDDCGQTALEVSGFILGQESAKFMASSAQFPVIARPFFNLNQNQEFSQLVAFPGVSIGNLQISAPSRLWGTEANLRCNVCCGCDYKVDTLVGFRYLDLNENIVIQENIQGLAGAPAPFTNAQTTVIDRFAAHNQFYGGQIGLDSEFRRGPWSLDLRGKLALGNTHQHLTIDGSEQIIAPNGTVQNFRGGLLALPSNIGQYSRDRFSVVPEIGISLGYQLTEHLRVSVGYNFLYWTNVLRPGNQIDRVLDVTQIPNFNIAGSAPTGQNRPTVPFKETDYWAHGLTVGLEFRY